MSDGGTAFVYIGGQGGVNGPSYAGGTGYYTSGGFGGGGGNGISGGGGGGGSYLDAALNTIDGLPSVASSGGDGFIVITYLPTGAVQTFGYTGAEQIFTFQATGLYDIVAAGAQGGSGYGGLSPGLGAEIGGEGTFTAGTTLSLIVGGQGSYVTGAGSGGGGSFVFLSSGPVSSPVPEPATWAMMIGGFALVGGALRRGRAIVVLA